MVIAGTDTGIYYSRDKGNNWSFGGLSGLVITSLSLTPSDYILAGTESSGVYITSTTTPAPLLVENDPTHFTLYQNYPNPFNPSTTISYELPQNVDVSLSVFNILGQEVLRLVNDKQSAGFHNVQVDGSSLSSGLYFYRLKAGSYLVTKKFIILR
jgi:hypothetical protein